MAKDVAKFIGYEFAPFQFTVERGKVREFAMAIGDANPVYTDRQAAVQQGFQDVTVPPTFPTVVDMWGGADFFELVQALELDPLKVLHGEQEYEYYGDVYPGDVIIAKSRVVDAKTKSGSSGGMNLFKLETEYTNQLGEPLLIARSTIVERF